MKPIRLLWRIYVYFLMAALAALAITTVNAVRTLRTFHEENVTNSLEVRARMAAREVLRYSLEAQAHEIDALCKNIGSISHTRMTVIASDGRVIGDSDQDPLAMDNHSGRPEIEAAFAGDIGTSVRYSDTLNQRLKYAAIPLQRKGDTVAVVRMSHPLAEIKWTQQAVSHQLFWGGLVSAILFAIVTLYFSRRTTRPLEDMRKTALKLAEGDLDARVTVTGDDEIGTLSRTINDMAEQLGDRVATIARQQVEQRAVLTCLVEGVLAVDTDGRILYLNNAVGQLLDIAPEQARERSIEAIVHHPPLQTFIKDTLTNTEVSESEILLRGVPEHHVQLHGTPLMDADGQRIGGLVVLNDITRTKRLERVRSDFVANVSHELKTPITALKGCTETLGNDEDLSPEDTARFMKMMSRHVLRLESIVEDLLSLSRIEFDTGQGQVQRDPTPIHTLLNHVLGTFAKRADAKQITIDVTCDPALTAPVNGPLLEQAVGNLVDNAIKYSDSGTAIRLDAAATDDTVLVSVSDRGAGIEPQHLERLFERFYRVDTARSRALGGTGLGLAIVKHIALAHQGNVAVDSRPGRGTTFTIHLPLTVGKTPQ